MAGIWILRARKLMAMVRTPAFRRAFRRHRVLPSVELDAFPFRDDYAMVLDVGANRGQFSLLARARFPRAAILAFEPGEAAAARYAEVFAGDAAVSLERCALGERAETRMLAVPRADDGASFVVDLGDASRQPVLVRTLDEWAGAIQRPALLKVDVQGFELPVLRGAGGALRRIDDVLVEVTLAPIDGQREGDEVLQLLRDAGFDLIAASIQGEAGDFFFRRRAQTPDPA